MKVGVVVPQFRSDTQATFSLVDQAEASGIDGVFFFDHLWPFGKTEGPALNGMTLLGATAARTERLRVGMLVARVAVSPNEVLLRQLVDVHAIAGHRLIAGLGVGESMSKVENEAYGVPWKPRRERLEMLLDLAARLGGHDVEVWLGGRSESIRELTSAHSLSLNVWQPADDGWPPPSQDFTWGGAVALDEREIANSLETARAAGARWAVVLVKGSGTRPVAAVDAVAEARLAVSGQG